MAGRVWNSEDIAYMQANLSKGVSIEEIASQLGRSVDSVKIKYNRLNVELYGKRSNRQEWTETEDRQLKDFIDRGYSYEVIADRMGRSRSSVIHRSSRLGYGYHATGARWTREDTELLKQWWQCGDYTIMNIAKRLQRTRAGVMRRAYELGLGYKETIGQKIKIVDVIENTGIPRTTLKKWIDRGDLQVKRNKSKGSPHVVKEEALLLCMEKNQHEFSAGKLDPDLFTEPPAWLLLKRKYDSYDESLVQNYAAKYTKAEEQKIIEWYRAGFSCRQIGVWLGRTTLGIKAKVQRLKPLQGQAVPDHEIYTAEELKYIKDHTPEFSLGRIAIELGNHTERSLEKICWARDWNYRV